MSLSEQGLTVNGEAPAHLLTWLVAIDAAYDEVRAEAAKHGPDGR